MASGVYNVGKKWFLDNDVATEITTTGSVWLLLMKPVTPAFTATRTNVTGVVTTDANTECDFTGGGTDYVTNGLQLTVGGATSGPVTATVVADQTDNKGEVRADVDVIWDTAGGTISNDVSCALLYAAVTPATPSKAVDIPLIFWDMTPLTLNGGDLTFNWGQDATPNRIIISI